MAAPGEVASEPAVEWALPAPAAGKERQKGR